MGHFSLLISFVQVFFDLVFILIFGLIKLRGLTLDSADLRVQDELLTHHIKLNFVDLLLLLLEVFPHLHVFRFE
jgi:hypothetical protein